LTSISHFITSHHNSRRWPRRCSALFGVARRCLVLLANFGVARSVGSHNGSSCNKRRWRRWRSHGVGKATPSQYIIKNTNASNFIDSKTMDNFRKQL
jgi:hypothetical protein